MHDSFSEGGIFYGRAMAIVGALVVLAVLIGLI
jgi:hypothetical protein